MVQAEWLQSDSGCGETLFSLMLDSLHFRLFILSHTGVSAGGLRVVVPTAKPKKTPLEEGLLRPTLYVNMVWDFG